MEQHNKFNFSFCTDPFTAILTEKIAAEFFDWCQGI